MTKHVEKNVMSDLQTERTCRREKVTTTKSGEVRTRWAHIVKYISRARLHPLVVMLLYQDHAEGLVSLFSEPFRYFSTAHLPHDKVTAGRRLWGTIHGYSYAGQQQEVFMGIVQSPK